MGIIDIINEELKNWFDDEPSVVDTYYDNKLNIHTSKPINTEVDYSGEIIGYINYQWNDKLPTPIPLVKNPTTLKGFDANCRGILLENGDVYISPTIEGFHDNILDLLYRKYKLNTNFAFSQYYETYPEEFIAVVRNQNTNYFTYQNTYQFLYDDEQPPLYYQELMGYANTKSNLTFTT